jgi:hypothetical protein
MRPGQLRLTVEKRGSYAAPISSAPICRPTGSTAPFLAGDGPASGLSERRTGAFERAGTTKTEHREELGSTTACAGGSTIQARENVQSQRERGNA